jgi:hypothetical protein
MRAITKFLFCIIKIAALLWLPTLSLKAELVRFEIVRREPFAEGMTFGDSGAYERIAGRVYYEINPRNPCNRDVIDLEYAPLNERGRVEYYADLFILAPADPNKSNGALLYDVNNRGEMRALGFFNNARMSNNPQSQADAGNGFLFRNGFTIVWSGWNGELLPNKARLRLFPPLASNSEKPITGTVRCEIVPNRELTRTLVSRNGHGSYRPTESGLQHASLTRRLLPGDPRVQIPRAKWKLIVTEVKGDTPAQLPKVELEYQDGFKKAHIYEVIYEAQDPVVMGTGLTAVRDLISALRHGSGQHNPLLMNGKPWIKHAYGFGVSQSGRFLREFVYWGFNVDEAGRKVFDGIIPHVSGSGRGSFNHRFAQPTRHAAQHDHHDYPVDLFPFAYETQRDPVSGQNDGILRRALATDTAPLVFHTQSSSEYWHRSGSLVHTDPSGTKDTDVPENVRIYFFGGTQHTPCGFPPNLDYGQSRGNPADYKPFLRALLVALHQWKTEGKPPPPSAYPKIKTGELVDFTLDATGFPAIPGIRFPAVIQQPAYLDFGPRWRKQGIINNQPPIQRASYKVLVPKSDGDGNDLGCLQPPEVAVPIATYTSWRLRSQKAGAVNELLSLNGSYIPFPVHKSERETKSDPRLSLAERYGTVDRYIEKLTEQCRKLVNSRYLLKEDTDLILKTHRKRAELVWQKD